MIPRESNDKLCEFHRRWRLNGDWLTCTGCKRSLIASRDGELMGHQADCKRASQQHPWAELRALIADAASQPDPTASAERDAGDEWGWKLRRITHAGDGSVTLDTGLSYRSPCFAGAAPGELWAVLHERAAPFLFGKVERAVKLEGALAPSAASQPEAERGEVDRG